jgi:FAD/FMN-containing dehydrogenase
MSPLVPMLRFTDHHAVFWALRGGGAGSWGVITSATFRTFPTFDASSHTAVITAPTNADAGTIATIHAHHAFDWDPVRAGQYFYMYNLTSAPEMANGLQGNIFAVLTYFKDMNGTQANASMRPFLDDVRAKGYQIIVENVTTATGNELLYTPDGSGGSFSVMGSRLIPERVYRENAEKIGQTYTELLDDGVAQ